MRGHAVYFYMLKDDLIESFKRVEEKLGGDFNMLFMIHIRNQNLKYLTVLKK